MFLWQSKSVDTWYKTVSSNRDFYERAVTNGIPAKGDVSTHYIAIANGKLVIVWQAVKGLFDVWGQPRDSAEYVTALETFSTAIHLNMDFPLSNAWETVLYRTPKGKPLYLWQGTNPTLKGDNWRGLLIDYWIAETAGHASAEARTRALTAYPLTWELRQLEIAWERQDAMYKACLVLRQQALKGIPTERLDFNAFKAALDMPMGAFDGRGNVIPYNRAPALYQQDFKRQPSRYVVVA